MKESTVNFYDMIYQVVRLVPKGRVTTYGAIAKYLATGRSARMVGWAMNNSFSVKPKIPAHRVVNRLGLLTGKFHFKNGPEEMQQLLEKEGVVITEDQVQNFEKVFWDPAIALDFS